MEPVKIKIKGILAEDILSFIEDQKMDSQSPYQSATIEEAERDYGDGSKAGVGEVVLLFLGIASNLVKDLFKDFLKNKLNSGVHSARYKMKNDRGEELEITLNGLSLKDVEEVINNFEGNIVEVSSVRDNGS